jgi:hypothetical protein
MQAPKIDYKAFDAGRLQKTPPQQKQSQPKPDPNNPHAPPAPITYYEIPLSYKYNVHDKDGHNVEVIGDLYVEGPELYSPGGINTKDMSGKPVHSIFTQFDLQDPEIQSFLSMDQVNPGMMHRLYMAVLQRLEECKGTVGLGRMQNVQMLEAVTTYPIHWPRDATTSQIIVGKNPSKFFSLFSYGSGYGLRRSLFCAPLDDEQGKTKILDWELLRGVEMKYRPLFHFKKVYIGGGKASIQFDVSSAVVTSVVKANTESNQTDTIAALKSNDALTNSLREQIAALNKALEQSKLEEKDRKPQLQLMSAQPQQPASTALMPTNQTQQYPPQYQAQPSTQQYQSQPPTQQYQAQPPTQQYQSQPPTQQYQAQAQQYQPQTPNTTSLSSLLQSGPTLTSFNPVQYQQAPTTPQQHTTPNIRVHQVHQLT